MIINGKEQNCNFSFQLSYTQYLQTKKSTPTLHVSNQKKEESALIHEMNKQTIS